MNIRIHYKNGNVSEHKHVRYTAIYPHVSENEPALIRIEFHDNLYPCMSINLQEIDTIATVG